MTFMIAIIQECFEIKNMVEVINTKMNIKISIRTPIDKISQKVLSCIHIHIRPKR